MQTEPAGRKSLKTTYLLWALLGFVGAHRFYLGRCRTGAIFVAFFMAVIAALVNGRAYTMTLATIGLLLALDAFLIPTMVRTASARDGDRPE